MRMAGERRAPHAEASVGRPRRVARRPSVSRVETRRWPKHAEWLEHRRFTARKQAWREHVVWLDAERARVEPEAWEHHEALRRRRAAHRCRSRG